MCQLINQQTPTKKPAAEVAWCHFSKNNKLSRFHNQQVYLVSCSATCPTKRWRPRPSSVSEFASCCCSSLWSTFLLLLQTQQVLSAFLHSQLLQRLLDWHSGMGLKHTWTKSSKSKTWLRPRYFSSQCSSHCGSVLCHLPIFWVLSAASLNSTPFCCISATPSLSAKVASSKLKNKQHLLPSNLK